MNYRDELEAGRDSFGHLIRVWHERNGWSQRVLPALAERLELGRVHNSQLSNLRNRKLASPGPELFVALGRINELLAAQGNRGLSAELEQQIGDQPELLEALQNSALPVLSDDAHAFGPADLFEIFVGLKQLPRSLDIRIKESEASELSSALAELFTAGRPWRLCRDQILAAYQVTKRQRRERFADVMAGQREYSAEELNEELQDLLDLLAALSEDNDMASFSPDQLLELLRKKAGELSAVKHQSLTNKELFEAIRDDLNC